MTGAYHIPVGLQDAEEDPMDSVGPTCHDTPRFLFDFNLLTRDWIIMNAEKDNILSDVIT